MVPWELGLRIQLGLSLRGLPGTLVLTARSPALTPRGDLPRPRLEMISRSVELLASRMARGSLSVKGNKSLRRHEGSEVKSGEGSVCPISALPPPNPQPGEEEPGNPAGCWNRHADWKLPWGRRVESGG